MEEHRGHLSLLETEWHCCKEGLQAMFRRSCGALTHQLVHLVCEFVHHYKGAVVAAFLDKIHHLIVAPALHVFAVHRNQSVLFLNSCTFCWAVCFYVFDDVSCTKHTQNQLSAIAHFTISDNPNAAMVLPALDSFTSVNPKPFGPFLMYAIRGLCGRFFTEGRHGFIFLDFFL